MSYYIGVDGFVYRACDATCDTCPEYCWTGRPATRLDDDEPDDDEPDDDGDEWFGDGEPYYDDDDENGGEAG